MQRSDALSLLSPTHARIVVLDELGLDRDQIAAELMLDPSAVAPVLSVARAKLAALERLDLDVDGAIDRPQGGGERH